MTDLSTESTLITPTPDQPTQPTPAPTPADSGSEAKPKVEHTAGGWPVVPFALTGTNATATLLAGAALAGGPIAAAVAATGVVVLGATAAHARKTTGTGRKAMAGADKTCRTAAAKSAAGTRHGLGRIPSQPKRGNASGPKPGSRAGANSAALGRKTAHPQAGAGSLRSAGTTAPAGRKPGTPKHDAGLRVAGGSAGSVKPRGRLGQVKALREQARAGSPSRAERRTGTSGARRQITDARRAAKQQARTTAAASKGPVGRAVARGTGAAGKAKAAATDRLRKARDASAAGKVAGQRSEVRKAPARKKARKALRRSAARLQGRRLLAAFLAGALGLIGLVSTPLGRWLGWKWMQQPGRRLYARLMKQAHAEREARDTAIREQQEADEQAADAAGEQHEQEQIGDTAERPAGTVPTTPTSESNEGDSGMSGFNFEEQAAEMESAAQNYEPENAMEILAMVEGLPAALTSVANVMRILAERADNEFPLEKQVADGFNDIFGALMSAVAVAEDMGPLFRTAHEQDIARHEDPRNGPEAEKGWNV
ncbi:hypothetical protein [Streptomyces sp. S1]|uniref:hypothetical protein n=1 Tax=Streptomyces sp. S1 TaxID=718288 RepID=UPI001F0923EC|nr:hypothetical protein [Streptomyces sp. S1]